MTSLEIDTWMKDLSPDFPDVVRSIEAQGADGFWFAESTHNPYSALMLAADATESIELGTRVALAFPRSPMITAYAAWDLAHYSNGRFILGLGTQVKAHNERRFSVPWEAPGPRLREVIESIQHIWRVWQGSDETLSYDGDFYSFSLMTENFDPGPINHPDIPVYIAAINEYNVRLAGELCDGICLHPFNSPSYIENVIQPWLERGAETGGRSVEDVTISASPFVITGSTDAEIEENREEVRKRVAFYGSTPSYRSVLDHHGWDDLGDRLHQLSRDGEWEKMGELIPDDMLYDYAIEAPLGSIEAAVSDEYGSVADRVVISADPTGQQELFNGIYRKP